MATLNIIESFLNIEIGDKKLKEGKKIPNKNQYYYYEQLCYIVKLTKDKWMIAEDCQKTRILLRNHCWSSDRGYARTKTNRLTKKWHQLFFSYEDGLVSDHINNKRYDNRIDNIRIVTYRDNNRNSTKHKNSSSGKQGVSRFIQNNRNSHYWRVMIKDNDNKLIQKVFSIKKLGDAEAKRQAIECRKQLEVQYGYIGD